MWMSLCMDIAMCACLCFPLAYACVFQRSLGLSWRRTDGVPSRGRCVSISECMPVFPSRTCMCVSTVLLPASAVANHVTSARMSLCVPALPLHHTYVLSRPVGARAKHCPLAMHTLLNMCAVVRVRDRELCTRAQSIKCSRPFSIRMKSHNRVGGRTIPHTHSLRFADSSHAAADHVQLWGDPHVLPLRFSRTAERRGRHKLLRRWRAGCGYVRDFSSLSDIFLFLVGGGRGGGGRV